MTKPEGGQDAIGFLFFDNFICARCARGLIAIGKGRAGCADRYHTHRTKTQAVAHTVTARP